VRFLRRLCSIFVAQSDAGTLIRKKKKEKKEEEKELSHLSSRGTPLIIGRVGTEGHLFFVSISSWKKREEGGERKRKTNHFFSRHLVKKKKGGTPWLFACCALWGPFEIRYPARKKRKKAHGGLLRRAELSRAQDLHHARRRG